MSKNFWIIFSLLLFFSCKEKSLKLRTIKLQKQVSIKNIPPGYYLNIYHRSSALQLIFSPDKAKQDTKESLFYIDLNKALKFKSIKIKRNKNDKAILRYKLYINGNYIGKFIEGKDIIINKKIKTLKILFLKKEQLIHAWQNDTVILLNKQKKIKSNFHIILNIDTKDSLGFHLQRNKYSKMNIYENKKFIEDYINSGSRTKKGMYYTKQGKKKTAFVLQLFDQNTFIIYELTSIANNKKPIREIFFTGYWQCKKIRNKNAQLIFSGKLSAYFSDKKIKFVRNKTVEIQVKLINNTLFFNKVLLPIYIDFPESALINVKEFIPTSKVKLAYASKENFTKTKLYPCNKCFIRYKVAKVLENIQKELQQKEMSLIFYDCYRPYYVQRLMFEKFPVKGYVAPPKGGSIHNRGLAVDLSIIDKKGKELDMGTGFDEFSKKAHHSYTDFSDTVLNNRLFLKNLMIKYGFEPIRSEWWHYNYLPKHQYPVINDEILCY